MKLFYHYFLIQLKRMFKSFPAIFFTTILLVLAISSLFVAQLKINHKSPEKQKYKIGLVGNLNETYLGFGIEAIENLDSSRFMIDFTEMSETEAQKALRNNHITAYIQIPDQLVESLIHGKDTRIRLVCGNSQNTLGTEIVKELAQSISKIVTESQAALYTAYHIYEADTAENTQKDLQLLNIQYFDLILGREKIYDVQESGLRNGLSMESYMLCSAIIIFLLFWGISCSAILTKKDMALSRLLAARGISPSKQCIGEYFSFCIFMSFNCFMIFSILLSVIKLKKIQIFPPDEAKQLIQTGNALWLLILCISAMLYFIYNLSQSLNSGIIMNFIVALIMGYFSGCFYPISYFPIFIQKLSHFLPAAISMNFLTGYVKNGQVGIEAFYLFLYTIIFLILSAFVRKVKLSK